MGTVDSRTRRSPAPGDEVGADVVRMHRVGGPGVLRVETEEVRAPARHEVRVRQEAVGLNYVDTYFRNGTFSLPLPRVIGVEGAGVVDAVGRDVQDLAIGDRVGYYFSPGAYRRSRLIDPSELVRLPDDVATDVAASILAKGITAWTRVRRVFPVGAGSLVVVTGASGGVGSLVAPWARRLGADVIAVVARPEAAAGLRSTGVDEVAVAGTGQLHEMVARAGRPVDVVFDTVGRAVLPDLAPVLERGSVLDRLGNASGDLGAGVTAALAAGVQVVQSSTGEHVPDRLTLTTAAQELFDALRKGWFGDRPLHRYPLRDVARAHTDIESRAAGPAPVLIP